MGSTHTRLLQLEDVPELTELLTKNRRFLQPWDPSRDEEFFTERRQTEIARQALSSYEKGQMVPLLIVDATGAQAGRLNINGVVRGAFQSASLGYWVSEDRNGTGLATAAVSEAVRRASEELNLHRLQAETLPHNSSSQRVLEKNGFSSYGVAPEYLRIAGKWQDHVLYQKILHQDAS